MSKTNIWLPKEKGKQTWLPKEKGEGKGRNWEFGVSMYKLLHVEWINNKDPPCGAGDSTQYLVITCNGEEPQKEYICVYVTESLS